MTYFLHMHIKHYEELTFSLFLSLYKYINILIFYQCIYLLFYLLNVF